MEIYETKSVPGTLALGRKLARRLKAGDCVALTGGLGAGKTALVRGIAEGLGLADRRLVSSPTFVLVQEYPTTVPMYHLDLYRLTAPDEELEALGFEEMLSDGVVLMEWGERARHALPHNHWKITIEITGPRSRRFSIAPPTSSPPENTPTPKTPGF